jgi:NAD(P)-dependent dehydrogenase (short-subunit alcohol dehydrogenase family)
LEGSRYKLITRNRRSNTDCSVTINCDSNSHVAFQAGLHHGICPQRCRGRLDRKGPSGT